MRAHHLEFNLPLRPDEFAAGAVNAPVSWQLCWLYVHNISNENGILMDGVVPYCRSIEADNLKIDPIVIWPPNLNTPPPQVIKPPVQVPQNLATQVYRDENPDKFVLSSADQKAFRKLYPLRKTPLLPARDPNDQRPTLVLDLDETLIHTTFENPSITQEYETLYVNLRPFVKPFLKAVAQWYEIVIYTASLSSYANAILDTLDPSDEIFSHRLFREHCSFFHGVYVKDLESLGRPLDKTVFVDNFPGAYMMQPSNALPVRSFVGSPSDSELFQVMKLLRILRFKDDFQPLLHRYRTHWKNIHFNPDRPRQEVEA